MRTLGELFDIMTYPMGESHVEMVKEVQYGEDILVPDCSGFEDLMNLVTANRIVEHNDISGVTWVVPYFPFGRHDRRRSCMDGLELQLAIDMIRDEGIRVVTFDPHSDVLGQLPHIPQCAIVNAVNTHVKDGLFPTDVHIVIPDAGATKKAMEWVGSRIWMQGHKYRDPATGQLSGFGVDCVDFGGCPVLIVDDICDGGGTFLGLLDELKKKNAGACTLMVTHGGFSKGQGLLTDAFDRVITVGFQDTLPGVESVPFDYVYYQSKFHIR